MVEAERRAFQAAMAVKDCAGRVRQAETVFGWSRQAVELGRHKQRTELVCLSARSAFGGDERWEEKPLVAAVLWKGRQMHNRNTTRPFGPVNEDTGAPHLTFGSSAKTSDFIVDRPHVWREQQPPEQREGITLVRIRADNGPESNGRTRFLNRFSGHIGKPIQLLYDPPYHSSDTQRRWGSRSLEQHWNGALPVDARTKLEWAKSTTWKGLNPFMEVSRQVDDRGISLSKAAMKDIEARLQRNPDLRKRDILIQPAVSVGKSRNSP